MIDKLTTRPDWLKARQRGIGGSDAGAVLGVNKYKTNVELWEEKTGRTTPEDISDKPAVVFGKTAEPLIRDLFRLDHPEYKVDYHEFWIYRNPGAPYIFATLDGELTAEDGRRGILEIKTCTIQHGRKQWEEWEDGVFRASVREYTIERSEVKEDLIFLSEQERTFWQAVESDRQPALILPEIGGK